MWYKRKLEEREKFLGRLEIGNKAEHYVNGLLLEKGYIPYSASNLTSQPFDKIIYNKNTNKLFLLEVKHKEKLKGGGFGINKDEYENYVSISKELNLPIFLVFVEKPLKYAYYIRLPCEPSNVLKNRATKKEFYIWKELEDFYETFNY